MCAVPELRYFSENRRISRRTASTLLFEGNRIVAVGIQGSLPARKFPLLFAICAPCQPFTRLAKKEMTDERKRRRAKDSGLLHEAYKFVRRFNPEIVLSENVADISGAKFGGIWEALGKELEEAGYVTGTRVVCTSNFGVPQYRKRSILLAVRRGIGLTPKTLGISIRRVWKFRCRRVTPEDINT